MCCGKFYFKNSSIHCVFFQHIIILIRLKFSEYRLNALFILDGQNENTSILNSFYIEQNIVKVSNFVYIIFKTWENRLDKKHLVKCIQWMEPYNTK